MALTPDNRDLWGEDPLALSSRPLRWARAR